MILERMSINCGILTENSTQNTLAEIQAFLLAILIIKTIMQGW
jgi:hypothetical protein